VRNGIRVLLFAVLPLVLHSPPARADASISICANATEVPQIINSTTELSPKEREIRTAYSLLKPHMPALRPFRIAVIEDDSDKSPGAMRCSGTGQPVIVVRQLFIDLVRDSQVGSDDYWKWLYFLSHEHAHVTLGHAERENELSCDTPTGRIRRADAEKAADYWAGFVLGKLGARRDDATAALRAIDKDPYLSGRGTCYPAMPDRLLSVEGGWEQAGVPSQSGQKALESFLMSDNRDLDSNDFLTVPANTVEVCAAACLDHERGRVHCKGFAYDKRYMQCYLKSHLVVVDGKLQQTPYSSSDVVLRFDPFSIVGIARSEGHAAIPSLIPLSPEQVPECDRFCTVTKKKANALFGTGSSTSASSTSACREKCRGDLQCLAAQWKPSTKDCKLYSTITGWHHDPDEGAVIVTRKYVPDPLCRGGQANRDCN
jgi:hypothetical protein